MKAIQVKQTLGLGDQIQFTSVPENYFLHTGEKLVDLERNPIFDHNPYVVRPDEDVISDRVYNLWDLHCFNKTLTYKERYHALSNAEAHARHFGYLVRLNRPRLYLFEDFPFHKRHSILLQVCGKSHGQMPEKIVRRILNKYCHEPIYRIGLENEWIYPFPSPPYIPTPTFWDLTREISEARMVIGMDSGPSWIARCYPDVVVKVVRSWPEDMDNYVPLEWCRVESLWDDRSAMVYNMSEYDRGFTWSYLKI